MGTSRREGKGKSGRKAARPRLAAPSRCSSAAASENAPCAKTPSPIHNKYPFSPIWSSLGPVPKGRIAVQVRQVIDRIQILIPVISGVWDALREELPLRGFSFKGEFAGKVSENGGGESKWKFEMDGCQVYLVRPENAAFPWFRLRLLQPSPKVQEAIFGALSVLPAQVGWKNRGRRSWYVSQIEVALDVMPENSCDLDLVRLHLEDGLTIPGVRLPQASSYKETSYYASNQDIRKAGHGFRVYLKPKESSPEYVRCELQMNQGKLDKLGLRGEKGLLLSPGEINVFSHLQYRCFEKKRLVSSLVKKFKEKAGRVLYPNLSMFTSKTVAGALDGFNKFKRRCPQYKKERVFLSSPKQRQLFEDLAQGFVRERYRTRPFGAVRP